MLASFFCKAKSAPIRSAWGTMSTICCRNLAVILLVIQEMKHKPSFLKAFWQSIRQAAIDFNNDNGFKLAASLSYSMIFAIGPLLIVVISLAGIFWGQQAVEGKIYVQIKDLVGNASALQIQDFIKYIQQSKHSMAGGVVGGGGGCFCGARGF